MNTAAISSASSQPTQPTYQQQRQADLVQLAQALKSGDLNGAQQAYNAIVSIGQADPCANGVPFSVASREQDFQAVGTALQAGDVAGAKQALQALFQTFVKPQSSASAPSNSSGVGPDVVVNLSGNQ